MVSHKITENWTKAQRSEIIVDCRGLKAQIQNQKYILLLPSLCDSPGNTFVCHVDLAEFLLSNKKLALGHTSCMEPLFLHSRSISGLWAAITWKDWNGNQNSCYPSLLPTTRLSPVKLLQKDLVLNMLVILAKPVGPAITPKEICLLRDFQRLKL